MIRSPLAGSNEDRSPASPLLRGFPIRAPSPLPSTGFGILRKTTPSCTITTKGLIILMTGRKSNQEQSSPSLDFSQRNPARIAFAKKRTPTGDRCGLAECIPAIPRHRVEKSLGHESIIFVLFINNRLISRRRSLCWYFTSRNSSGMDGGDSTFYRRGLRLPLMTNLLCALVFSHTRLDP